MAFDALLPLGDQVPAAVLRQAVPAVAWDSIASDGAAWDSADSEGMELEPGGETAIRALWATHGPAHGADPTQPAPGTYPASAVVRVTANRYEHDATWRGGPASPIVASTARPAGSPSKWPTARRAPTSCTSTTSSPPSQLGNGYVLDPLTDLVPLCANCHAMAHRGVNPPRTEAQLRHMMAAAGNSAAADPP